MKISAQNPAQAVSATAKAMVKLANDKNLLLQMGQSGQQRVKKLYSWEAKGKQLSQVYEEVIAGQKP